MNRRALVATVLLVAATATWPAGSGVVQYAGDAFDEQTRVRVRAVRLRFEPRRSAPPEACHAIGLGDLEVMVRDQRLDPDRLLKLERRAEPTVHALLLDTSDSMMGRLERVQQAARDYLGRLDPAHERALVLTFDDTVTMVHPTTRDVASLLEATSSVRVGATTSMYDALYYGIRELRTYRDRPVVLLLTDGVDSASLRRAPDVNRMVDGRSDLTVFTIGIGLPGTETRPPDEVQARGFLKGLSESTEGRFFDLTTAGGLDRAFRRIREILDNEATLLFLDPDPDRSPGRVTVVSRVRDCGVKRFKDATDVPVRGVAPANPVEAIPVAAGPAVFPDVHDYEYLANRKITVDADCAGATGGRLRGRVDLESGRVSGCALDMVMEPGTSYRIQGREHTEQNPWLRARNRPFEFDLLRPADLPRDPVSAMDDLGRHARAVRDAELETDASKRPAELHARPYHDYPALQHGRTFLEGRDHLARVMYRDADYREFVESRLAAERDRDMERLVSRLRHAAPELSDPALHKVALATDEGLAIHERAARPTPDDLKAYLAAWLGDLSAHELFVRWEIDRLNRWLAQDDSDPREFAESWHELRRVFFVPSYARVLTLLVPGYDEPGARIGFWRVMLPRPGWLGARQYGRPSRFEYRDLPLDLIPDQPYAMRLLTGTPENGAELARHLQGSGYRVRDLSYRLLGKPSSHAPRRAFHDTEVRLTLEGAGRVEWSAAFHREENETEARLESQTVEVSGDPLASWLAQRLTGSRVSPPGTAAQAALGP